MNIHVISEGFSSKNLIYFFTLVVQFILTSMQNLKPVAQNFYRNEWKYLVKLLLNLTYYKFKFILLIVQNLDNNISYTNYTVQIYYMFCPFPNFTKVKYREKMYVKASNWNNNITITPYNLWTPKCCVWCLIFF